jgi:hypothetical protein
MSGRVVVRTDRLVVKSDYIICMHRAPLQLGMSVREGIKCQHLDTAMQNVLSAYLHGH